MNLITRISHETLSAISESLQFHDAQARLTLDEAELIVFLVKNKHISQGRLSDAVHRALCGFGAQMHEDHVRRGLYPDHVRSPEAYAYAIRMGWLQPRAVAKIRLDHGETLERFKTRSEGLLEKIVKQLVDGPKPLPALHEMGGGTICEGCGQ